MKKKTKPILIFFIVLLLIVIIGVGFFATQQTSFNEAVYKGFTFSEQGQIDISNINLEEVSYGVLEYSLSSPLDTSTGCRTTACGSDLTYVLSMGGTVISSFYLDRCSPDISNSIKFSLDPSLVSNSWSLEGCEDLTATLTIYQKVDCVDNSDCTSIERLKMGKCINEQCSYDAPLTKDEKEELSKELNLLGKIQLWFFNIIEKLKLK